MEGQRFDYFHLSFKMDDTIRMKLISLIHYIKMKREKMRIFLLLLVLIIVKRPARTFVVLSDVYGGYLGRLIYFH